MKFEPINWDCQKKLICSYELISMKICIYFNLATYYLHQRASAYICDKIDNIDFKWKEVINKPLHGSAKN